MEKSGIIKHLKWTSSVIVVGLSLAIFLRVFIFSSFIIPTQSMHPALINGDYVVVNKLIPGPRVLRNLFYQSLGDSQFWGLNLYRPVDRNDVVVFKSFSSLINSIQLVEEMYFAKRCIGIPGDIISIQNDSNMVRCNTLALETSLQKRITSHITDRDFETIQHIFDSSPYDSIYFKWKIRNFGPLYIPKKGDLVSIDSININLYKNIIESETKKKITTCDGKVSIDNKLLSTYLFQQNYYFVTGDNAFESYDSRYWGLLPENEIVGKIAFIFSSKDELGKYRPDRFFRTVN